MSYAADFVRHTRADLDIDEVSLTTIETLERADAELARKDERIAELEAALKECADDLEAELKDRWHPGTHPVTDAKYERDMEPVTKARALLERKP